MIEGSLRKAYLPGMNGNDKLVRILPNELIPERGDLSVFIGKTHDHLLALKY